MTTGKRRNIYIYTIPNNTNCWIQLTRWILKNDHIWKEILFKNHHFSYLCWISGVYPLGNRGRYILGSYWIHLWYIYPHLVDLYVMRVYIPCRDPLGFIIFSTQTIHHLGKYIKVIVYSIFALLHHPQNRYPPGNEKHICWVQGFGHWQQCSCKSSDPAPRIARPLAAIASFSAHTSFTILMKAGASMVGAAFPASFSGDFDPSILWRIQESQHSQTAGWKWPALTKVFTSWALRIPLSRHTFPCQGKSNDTDNLWSASPSLKWLLWTQAMLDTSAAHAGFPSSHPSENQDIPMPTLWCQAPVGMWWSTNPPLEDSVQPLWRADLRCVVSFLASLGMTRRLAMPMRQYNQVGISHRRQRHESAL